jgi:hypothetical protein
MEVVDPMNATDKLDYVLGQLDHLAVEVAEREIASDPALAESLDRLGQAINRLLDDGETIQPPEGLARRTVALVMESRRRRRTILDFVPVKVPFRWADFAVAAGIFLASVLTLMPAFHRSRERMEEAGCGFNLQQLGLSLAQYGMRHGFYPYAPEQSPTPVAGSFAALLHDDGLLHDVSALDCPCNGTRDKDGKLPHFETLCKMRREAPDDFRKLLSWDYAYNVGYNHASGRPGPVPASLSATIPLLGDQPPHQDGRILAGNSPNHHYRGQNIVFTDGHVGWFNTRRISPLDSDVFLNNEQQPAPGLHEHDAVLMPSLFSRDGRR